jgi:hypothetical protein
MMAAMIERFANWRTFFVLIAAIGIGERER